LLEGSVPKVENGERVLYPKRLSTSPSNDYIDRKNKTYGDFTNIDYTRIFPSLASDGRGLMGEIIMMSILTAVTSLFIIVRVAVAIKSW